MLKLRNETKIGILAIVAIALGVWGFKFLKGINILTTSQTFYARFDHVDQLRPASPVFLSGLQVGVVKRIYQDPEDGRKIITELNIERGVKVPKDARAVIIGQSLMGGKAMMLDFTTPCSGPDCAVSGQWLEGEIKNFLQSLVGDPSEIDEYTRRLQVGLTAVYDSIADPRDPHGFGRTLVALQTTLTNLAAVSGKLNQIMAANAASISATTANAAEITRTLRESNKSITGALANLETITSQLKSADLDQSAKKAGVALDSVTASLAALRATLASTGKTIEKVDALAQKLNSGDGTAGKFLTDPELYDNLVRDTRHLHLLMQDLRLNPKRYTTVKLKVFGKNKTKDYENPLDDPAYQLLIDSLERAHSRKLKN